MKRRSKILLLASVLIIGIGVYKYSNVIGNKVKQQFQELYPEKVSGVATVTFFTDSLGTRY